MRGWVVVDEGVDLVDIADQFGGEDGFRGAGSRDGAVVEDDKVVAVPGGEVQVMQGDDARQVEGTQELEEFELVPDIEMVGRLVEQDLGRLLREGPGELGALFFTTGERVPDPVLLVADPDPCEGAVDNTVIRLFRFQSALTRVDSCPEWSRQRST